MPRWERTLGTLDLASREENAFTPADIGLLEQVATQVAVAMENARADLEIKELKSRLAQENLPLKECNSGRASLRGHRGRESRAGQCVAAGSDCGLQRRHGAHSRGDGDRKRADRPCHSPH